VEGCEESVLNGLDLTTIRPWILLIESTLPLSQVESHLKWEHQLLEAGYQCVYFDGLNRFYLAAEHQELSTAFNAPPNVFDGFRTYETVSLELQAMESQQQLLALQSENNRLEAHIAAQFAEMDRLKQEILRQAAELNAIDQRRTSELDEARKTFALELTKAQSELKQVRLHSDNETEKLRRELNIAQEAQKTATMAIQSLLNSRSWKITAPLRLAFKLIRKSKT
jgi:hypothetical protein